MNSPTSDPPVIVLITAPNPEVGGRIARGAVEGALAACVNIVPGITSIYRWKGGVCEDNEVLLIAKTTREALSRLEAFVTTNHPYETPEFVAITPEMLNAGYAQWIVDSVA